ncbi:MAG: Ig-like domain-containing protein [Novosphingobium sp.]
MQATTAPPAADRSPSQRTPIPLTARSSSTLDGTWHDMPDYNFNGEDSFTHTVTDEETGESLTRTVTITVGAENDLTAQDDTNTTSEDTPVSGSVAGNDSIISGGSSPSQKDSDPANGTVVVNPDGTYTYTPDDNFNGEDKLHLHRDRRGETGESPFKLYRSW